MGSQVVGRWYKPSSGNKLALFMCRGEVVYNGQGGTKKLSKVGVVVDSAGVILGKGPDAATKKWRWDLQTGVFNKKKGIRWTPRKAGEKLTSSKLPLPADALIITRIKGDSDAEAYARDHPWLIVGRVLCEIDGSSEKCAKAVQMLSEGNRDGFRDIVHSATTLEFCPDEECAKRISGAAAVGPSQHEPSRELGAAAPAAAAAAPAAAAAAAGSSHTRKRPRASASTGSDTSAVAKRTKRQSGPVADTGVASQATTSSSELIISEDTNVGLPSSENTNLGWPNISGQGLPAALPAALPASRSSVSPTEEEIDLT